ncbi:MAG TPA: CRTAC1 family protein [Gemmatimonadales bacterium]|nr:CRTAC1 family protein [Gemmatimonadales bacterium]
MPQSRPGLRLALGLAVFALACGAPHTRPVGDGTARMADTLAKLNAKSVAEAIRNPFLNRERSEALRTLLAGASGRDRVEGRFALASELLMAGRNRDAIAQLDTLAREAPVPPDPKTNKGYFDLLGIAWLRLGEQENCALNPAANMCILPLDGAARHTRQEGARNAIDVYRKILAVHPDDLASRYLLNIAYLALGGYPEQVPGRFLIGGLGTRRDPAFPVYHNIAGDAGVAVEGQAGGVCIEDFTGDGLLDLFTTSWGLADTPHFFVADGMGGYSDEIASTGLDGIVGGLNCVHADYDNDGKEDLLIVRGAWLGDAGTFPFSLIRNLGGGKFADVTVPAGLFSPHPSNSAAFGDFNLDGRLDIAVAHESQVRSRGNAHRTEVYQQQADGSFKEVSHQLGIDLDEFVKAVSWGDVNNDGYPDLFASVFMGPNRLYLNRGGKRFEEVSQVAGIERPLASFPAWFWDYDNDGWEDLLVLSYDVRNGGELQDAVAAEYLGIAATVNVSGRKTTVEPSALYHNNGDGTFTDVTREQGLSDKVIFAMGSNYGDLDNDGLLDFYVGTGNPELRAVIPNRMFRARPGGPFEEVSVEGGFAHIQKGHATAFVDLDQDGDEDIYAVIGGAYQGDIFTSVLFENPGWPATTWISLELQGTTANRSAIGARVEITVADSAGQIRKIHRTVGTGGSFGAGSLRLHAGLGTAARIEEVRVRWPDATRTETTYANLQPGRSYQIVQGSQPVELTRPVVPFRKGVGRHH